MKKLIPFIFASIIASKAALGYLDPGTGGAIMGSLWPLIVAFFSAVIAFLVKYFWNPIKGMFTRAFKKEEPAPEKSSEEIE